MGKNRRNFSDSRKFAVIREMEARMNVAFIGFIFASLDFLVLYTRFILNIKGKL